MVIGILSGGLVAASGHVASASNMTGAAVRDFISNSNKILAIFAQDATNHTMGMVLIAGVALVGVATGYVVYRIRREKEQERERLR